MDRGFAHVHAWCPPRRASSLAPAVLLALSAPWAAAQSRPEPPTVLVVPALRGADSATRVNSASAVAERLAAAAGPRELRLVPPRDVRENLIAAGYKIDEPLTADDARNLARILRADAIISGDVRQDRTGYRIDLTLALLHERESDERVETGTGASADRAAARAVAALRTSVAQLPAERSCRTAAANGRAAEAVQVARAAAAKAPGAVLLRGCVLRAMQVAGAAPESVLVVANEILARDPLNMLALRIASEASARAGDKALADRYGAAYQVQEPNCAPPQGSAGLEGTAGELAAFDSIVRLRPASLGCRAAQFRAIVRSRDWPRAVATVDTLAQLDTTYASEGFRRRFVGQLIEAGQPELATKVMGPVTAARPQSIELWQLYAQTMHAAGEHRQAIGVARYALGLDSTQTTTWLRMMVEHGELNEPDSVLTLARAAAIKVTDSASRTTVGQLLLSQGNRLFQDAQKSQARAAYGRVLVYLAVVDTLSGEGVLGRNSSFLTGASLVMMSQSLIKDAATQRSCELARQAQSEVNAAQVALPKGSATNPAAAAQLMRAAVQVSDYAGRLVSAFCGTGRDE